MFYIIISEKGNINSVKTLKRLGATPEARNKRGLTVLMHAAENNQIYLVKELPRAGAVFESLDNEEHTVLIRAVKIYRSV